MILTILIMSFIFAVIMGHVFGSVGAGIFVFIFELIIGFIVYGILKLLEKF